jgi:hypothetical protein
VKMEESRLIQVGKVAWGTPVKVEHPDYAESGGVGPCVALAVYHYGSKSGYMMHVNDLLPYIDRFEEVVRADYGTLDNLEVMVVGGAKAGYVDTNAENREELLQELIDDNATYRNEVIERLDASFGKVTYKWLDEDQLGELVLDTQEGELRSEIQNLAEYGVMFFTHDELENGGQEW